MSEGERFFAQAEADAERMLMRNRSALLYGMPVVVHADTPRYTLPARLELPCGHVVEWPAGFREDFNAWSHSYLGRLEPLIPDGHMFKTGDDTLHMNPRTWESVRKAVWT